MATMVKSFALQGVDAYVVDIEAKALDGIPMITVIGMGDQAIKEAAEWITAALADEIYIVEAGKKSGALITAEYGEKYGKKVYFCE